MTQRGMRERHGRTTFTNKGNLMMEEIPSAEASYYGHAAPTNTSIMRKSREALPMDDADIAAGLRQQQRQQMTSARGGKATVSGEPSSSSSSAMVVGFAAEPPSRSASNSIMTAPSSLQSLASLNTRPEHHPSDLEFFEDLVSEPVLVLGVDISHLTRQSQFLVCASGVFGFSLLYGYLQELISVELCNRQLGLFLAMMQFSGYTLLAYVLRNFVYAKSQKRKAELITLSGNSLPLYSDPTGSPVPFALYVALSLLRAIDLGMTNLAMQYINYPAKTLMKSSRVVFTMLFGVLIARKVYKTADYLIVMGMVAGLALFMHADANSSAVFDWAGVAMLTISLLCDGAISNMSETIMNRYGVGQDEFIFRMYSIALVAITAAAAAKGDLREGFIFMTQPGSYGPEMSLPLDQRTWSVPGKVAVMVLFSSMGFFGSSCSAAITKNFGALTMSITSTARKATTLFLSFFLFNNVCTLEHLLGVLTFIAALTAKSLRRGNHKSKHKLPRPSRTVFEPRIPSRRNHAVELETRALLSGGGGGGNLGDGALDIGFMSADDMDSGMLMSKGSTQTMMAPGMLSTPPSSLTHPSDPSSQMRDRRGRSRQRKTAQPASPTNVQIL